MKKLKFLLIGAVAAFALSSGVGVVSAGGPPGFVGGGTPPETPSNMTGAVGIACEHAGATSTLCPL